MYQYILTEVKDRVATITINRPDEGNTMSGGTAPELQNALESFGRDESVGAIVITGAGKNFCVGGNIANFKERIETEIFLQPETVIEAGNTVCAIRQCPKPVIAMVNGAAAGAGCGVALACDFRILEERSKLALAFINLGLSGDSCCMFLLAKLVGVARMTEMMMYGSPLTAQQALNIGLANRVAQHGQLAEVTAEFVKKLAHGPTFAYAKQKELFNRYFYTGLEDFNVVETNTVCECGRTADFAESVYAFLEKRKPVYLGK